VIWVLDAAVVVVMGVVVAAVDIVVDDDVAVTPGASGCETRGWGAGWSIVGWAGSEYRRSRGAGGDFGAGREVVVVVDDKVAVVDGGCAGVVSGDVAALAGEWGLATSVEGSFLV
jgi:hypothetical protein